MSRSGKLGKLLHAREAQHKQVVILNGVCGVKNPEKGS